MMTTESVAVINPELSCPPMLLVAIVVFAAIAPGVLMTAPAIATQLAAQWQLTPRQIGYLFSAELGAMSLATVPAWWWIERLNWRSVAILAAAVFFAGNLASAATNDYSLLLLCRFITSLAGGTLMILSITCAATTPNPGRVYALWVLGQLLLGMLGLLILPPLFAHFGLMAVYLLLAVIILCCLPLLRAFPMKFRPNMRSDSNFAAIPIICKVIAVLAVLTFYIGQSAVWTFIGHIGSAAGLSHTTSGQVLAVAMLGGILGACCAALMANWRYPGRLMFGGYLLLITGMALLSNDPLVIRFISAAVLFVFCWNFVLPFILARVAALDNSGRLMNSINLVIGGGLAIGPSLAGYLIEAAGPGGALLAAICSTGFSLLLIIVASVHLAPKKAAI